MAAFEPVLRRYSPVSACEPAEVHGTPWLPYAQLNGLYAESEIDRIAVIFWSSGEHAHFVSHLYI